MVISLGNLARLTTLLFGLSSALVCAGEAPWVLVDTASKTLTVLDRNDKPLELFRNISVGRGGVAPLHSKGDKTTPLGSYRITHIRTSRSFDTFFQLNYPTPIHAELAFQRGLIDSGTRDAITRTEETELPPQATALGGEIGIHGVGRGSLRIHRLYNWTSGCIALTNVQLHRFARWARPGMRVVIR